MRRLTNFGSALVIALLVATGMVAFNTPVQAQGPGGGNSQRTLCSLLANAEIVASALPDSEFKTALLLHIDEQQAALNCGV
jgi:hypothetical protein